jgi:diketogulonate reductase-like aldo/keto reductase
MTNVRFNNGVEIPILGYGVFRVVSGDECVSAIKTALESGYKHIDTAAAYKNEESVGKAILESGIARSEIFITTKLSNDAQRSENVQESFTLSLEKLGTDYVDLYIIHWPVKECYVQSWLELEKIYKSGRAKAIGVSNFNEHHLDTLKKVWSVVPALNQIELHPYLTQKPLLNYCKKAGIVAQSWSPLGGNWNSGGIKDNLLENEILVSIGKRHKKSAAQVVLRWNIQQGIVTIPKSVTPSRIKENIDIFDFELSGDDMNAIDALNKNLRGGPDPDNFSF